MRGKWGIIASLLLTIPNLGSAQGFLEEFPHLKEFTAEETSSNIYFGFGISPITILNAKPMFTLNPIQVHYMNPYLDWEILSGSIGLALPKENFTRSISYIVRTIPKYRINDFISVGVVFGFEYISFPDVISKQTKDGFVTPDEPFSSNGIIYGAAASQVFKIGSINLRLNQIVYQQNYSTQEIFDGWSYRFNEEEIELDPNRELIQPSTAFVLEVSIYY